MGSRNLSKGPVRVARNSFAPKSSRRTRFCASVMVFFLGTLVAIGGSCGRSTLLTPAISVGSTDRLNFEGYLPQVLPSGYSLIRRLPNLVSMVASAQAIIIGTSHADGSFDHITTVEEWPSLHLKQKGWWLGSGEPDSSTFVERVIDGNTAVVQEEFVTSGKGVRFQTLIWLDIPECKNGLRIESPGVLGPEDVVSEMPKIACRGGVLSVLPETGREVLAASRLSNLLGEGLIFDNQDHSGRFELTVRHRTMPKALAEALSRLTPARSTSEDPQPKPFAGHSTIITYQADGSSTSYKWQEGTVSFQLVAIDAAEGFATEFIEAIRPIQHDAFQELLETLSSEPPPHLRSSIPEPLGEPDKPEPPETATG
jgi:hypothetical protein